LINEFVIIDEKVIYKGKPIAKMSCGAEFSMILDAVGNVYSFGSPEYGQLGI
jgi:alpha-tubulin suppressor-like RCC1 family protein